MCTFLEKNSLFHFKLFKFFVCFSGNSRLDIRTSRNDFLFLFSDPGENIAGQKCRSAHFSRQSLAEIEACGLNGGLNGGLKERANDSLSKTRINLSL